MHNNWLFMIWMSL